jgi:hypothetical protein
MSIGLISEIWKILRPNLESGDPEHAAEMLVNYMIDEDYSSTEIKNAFRGDSYIKDALEFYLEKPEDGLYHEEDEDPYDYDEPDEDEEY